MPPTLHFLRCLLSAVCTPAGEGLSIKYLCSENGSDMSAIWTCMLIYLLSVGDTCHSDFLPVSDICILVVLLVRAIHKVCAYQYVYQLMSVKCTALLLEMSAICTQLRDISNLDSAYIDLLTVSWR